MFKKIIAPLSTYDKLQIPFSYQLMFNFNHKRNKKYVRVLFLYFFFIPKLR